MISFPTSMCRHCMLLLLIGQLTLTAFSVHAAEVVNAGIVNQMPRLAILARPAIPHAANTVTLAKKRTDDAAKRLASKALTPVRATITQLGRPLERSLEWLNSARRNLWPSTVALSRDTYYLEPIDSPRLLDVSVNPRSMFSLGSIPTQTTRLGSPDDYALPNSREVIASNNASASELQVRMADDWGMLYVLDRSSTDLNGYTVSIGLGLRHSF